MMQVFDDVYFMRKALEEAQLAFEKGEVPVGAVVVSNQQIIARAHNSTEQLNDVTAHAEMLAITSAANYLGGKYLKKCKLYVSLEPCQMCAGALYWSQIDEVIYGASDPKRGFRKMGTQMHPKIKIKYGIMAKEAQDLLQAFFNNKRK
ncbi:nucleoside deaminase [Psychroflexus maritimus]|uniref:tRNA-specific adenosine deaminase n=1 Tax=Psychroflexus maritimus TaxID=2714865 RepID=A0A967ACC2_9FLAO|nr:nucleoside deaminase [Psychroflexus maritimus]NGZ89486.1 nucleoside deaminase [Psychroflexus maritimus]